MRRPTTSQNSEILHVALLKVRAMYESFISDAAFLYNVPQPWIQAVIQVESNWNPAAYNPNDPTGAWGLMQILYRTAQALGYTGTQEGLFDPRTNIDLGAKLLGQLRIQYGNDFRRIYSAYNSGDPDKWQWSEEVYSHVMRALDALQEFMSGTGGVSVGILLVVAMVAFLAIRKGL